MRYCCKSHFISGKLGAFLILWLAIILCPHVQGMESYNPAIERILNTSSFGGLAPSCSRSADPRIHSISFSFQPNTSNPPTETPTAHMPAPILASASVPTTYTLAPPLTPALVTRTAPSELPLTDPPLPTVSSFYTETDGKESAQLIERVHFDFAPAVTINARSYERKHPLTRGQWRVYTADEQSYDLIPVPLRCGSPWVSPPGVNLYTAFNFHWPSENKDLLHYVSFTACIAVAQTLESFGLSAHFRGSNDTFVNHQKISGVGYALLHHKTHTEILLNVGLNVNMNRALCQTVDQPATSMFIESGKAFDRDLVLKKLSHHLTKNITLLLREGYIKTLFPYQVNHTFSMGDEVILTTPLSEEDREADVLSDRYIGIFKGLDKNGRAILETIEDGNERAFDIHTISKLLTTAGPLIVASPVFSDRSVFWSNLIASTPPSEFFESHERELFEGREHSLFSCSYPRGKHLPFIDKEIMIKVSIRKGNDSANHYHEGIFKGFDKDHCIILEIDGIMKTFPNNSIALKKPPLVTAPGIDWFAGLTLIPVAAGEIDLATGIMTREDIITDTNGNIIERRRHPPTLSTFSGIGATAASAATPAMPEPGNDEDPDEGKEGKGEKRKAFEIHPKLPEDLGKSAWQPPKEALDKVPAILGRGRLNRDGKGFRWSDGDKGDNVIRVDKGNPIADYPNQRVDHVSIVKKGQTIGRDGIPIMESSLGLKPSKNTDAHIPLSEWVHWIEWFKP